MSSHCLGGPQIEAISRRVPLKSNNRPSVVPWALELQQFSYGVEYRKVQCKVVADSLSRQPEEASAKFYGIKIVTNYCPWFDKLFKQVEDSPENTPDSTIVNNRLYGLVAPQQGEEGEEDQSEKPIKPLLL